MDKATVRAEARTRRADLAAEARDVAHRAIADHLLALPELGAEATVLAYAAHGDEASVDAVIESLLREGRRVLLPRVDGVDLQAVAVTDLADAAPGYRGVREPTGPAESLEDVAVVLVPGVAFDRAGGRLGQGGGHYDRLLARLPQHVVRIGVAFGVQVIERVPRTEHDQPVDLLVTEAEAARTLARGSG